MHHRTSRHAHRGYREAMVSGLGWGNGWNHAEHSALHNEIAALIESGAIDPELGRCKAALERLQEHGERYSHQGYDVRRSEEHTSELQSLMRISYAVFCLKKKTTRKNTTSQVYISYTVKTTTHNITQ